MVGHIHILPKSLFLLSVSFLDVGFDFTLKLLLLPLVSWPVLNSVPHLKDFKTKSCRPLSVELRELLLLAESRCYQLLAPEWLMHLFG
jgi:hypothetical protein